jgi:lipoic acid synthetase
MSKSAPHGRTFEESATGSGRPEWLKVRLPAGKSYFRIKELLKDEGLNTVCQDARCPNIGECWGAGTATIMILGEVCTRACKFCAVKTGRPPTYDLDEPRRVARAIRKLGLRYAVITSVDRDDLADGGAQIYAETIRQIRDSSPDVRIEVLIPDFRGSQSSLRLVMEAGPDVLAHNLETVPRLYRTARAGSRYDRSLSLLRDAKSMDAPILTKSSLMVGLGEEWDELLLVIKDLHDANVDILTLGQYLQPTKDHLPVKRFYSPEDFAALKESAASLGFAHVAAGPLVRSSYRAEQQATLSYSSK